MNEALAMQVRELLARSQRIARRSAILVESSRHARSHTSLVARCAWCRKVRVGGVWAQAEEVPGFLADLLPNRETHGICPGCLEEVERRTTRAVPVAPTVVLVHTAGPIAVACLKRALRDYPLREGESFALEATLPNAGGAALATLLSTVSSCLGQNRLGPVTIELSDRTYVLGEGAPAPDAPR